MVLRVFSARAVENLRSRTQQIATQILDQIDPRSPVDLVATYRSLLPVTGCPEQRRRLAEREDLWPNAVEEVLRLDPPVLTIGRMALADTEVVSVPRRRGSLMVALLAGANRDPHVFPDSDTFDVTRRNARDHFSYRYRATWQSGSACHIGPAWQVLTVCRRMRCMAAKLDIDTKLSNEGRVVIPATVRAALGVGPGDRVRFVVEDGEVRLVTAKSLLFAVWANNHGGDGGDSVVDVRRARQADSARSSAKWDRVAALAQADVRSEDEIEEGLLAQLGLPL